MIQVFHWKEGGRYVLSDFVIGEETQDGRRMLLAKFSGKLDPNRCFFTTEQCMEDYNRKHMQEPQS